MHRCELFLQLEQGWSGGGAGGRRRSVLHRSLGLGRLRQRVSYKSRGRGSVSVPLTGEPEDEKRRTRKMSALLQFNTKFRLETGPPQSVWMHRWVLPPICTDRNRQPSLGLVVRRCPKCSEPLCWPGCRLGSIN
jgi:hypothetical protein